MSDLLFWTATTGVKLAIVRSCAVLLRTFRRRASSIFRYARIGRQSPGGYAALLPFAACA